jgi:hypothetical protein
MSEERLIFLEGEVPRLIARCVLPDSYIFSNRLQFAIAEFGAAAFQNWYAIRARFKWTTALPLAACQTGVRVLG